MQVLFVQVRADRRRLEPLFQRRIDDFPVEAAIAVADIELDTALARGTDVVENPPVDRR